MPHLDRSTDHVRQHLETHGAHLGMLTVQTEPGPAGRVITTVTNARKSSSWTYQAAIGLKRTLRGLPGSLVHLRPAVDSIFVVWDGVS